MRQEMNFPANPSIAGSFLEYAAGVGAMAALGGSVFGQAQNDAATGAAQPDHKAASTDSRLPDGTEFVSWEQPLKFSKTYYVDNQSAKADDNGPGTGKRPFRTINKAAQVLQPGERVVIASGTYRECVRPVRGGTGPAQMISYEAAPGAKVFVKGSEVLKDGWKQESIPVGFRGFGGQAGQPGSQKSPHGGTNSMAQCSPMPTNPSPCPAWRDIGNGLIPRSVDMGPYFRRRGLVFVDGKPLEPMEQLRELAMPHLQPVPISPFHRCRKTACLRAAAADPSCRRLAARPMPGSGLKTREPRFTFVSRRAHLQTTSSKSPPATGLRPLGKGACLHPGQGNHLPARRQRLPVSAVRHGLHSLAAITGSSKTTPSSGPTVSASTSATTGIAVSRRKPEHRKSSARNTHPLLRRRRYRRHGNPGHRWSKTI